MLRVEKASPRETWMTSSQSAGRVMRSDADAGAVPVKAAQAGVEHVDGAERAPLAAGGEARQRRLDQAVAAACGPRASSASTWASSLPKSTGLGW